MGCGAEARGQRSERAPLPSPKDLVNIEMFLTAKEVEESLERRETATCLAWCHDNKSRLRKMKVRWGGEGGAPSPGWQGRRLGAGGAPDWVGLGAGRAGHGLRGGAEAATCAGTRRLHPLVHSSLVLALGWGGCVWCGFGVILVVHLLLRYGLDQCSEREFLREEVPTTCKQHGSHCWGGAPSPPLLHRHRLGKAQSTCRVAEGQARRLLRPAFLETHRSLQNRHLNTNYRV